MADVGDFPAGRSLARYGVEADQEIDGRVELAGDEVDRRVPAPAVPDEGHGMAFGGVEVHDVTHFAAFVVLAEPDVVLGAEIGGPMTRTRGRRSCASRAAAFSMKSFSCRLSRMGDRPHRSRSRSGLR